MGKRARDLAREDQQRTLAEQAGPPAAGRVRGHRPPDHSPCSATASISSSQQAPLTWPASAVRNRPHHRQARPIKQDIAHNKHAGGRGNIEAVSNRKELQCLTRL